MNSLTKFKANMRDNIDSMDSLMTIMDCDLFIIEHILLCAGDCYYYDDNSNKIVKAFLFLDSTEEGDIIVYLSFPEDSSRNVIAIEPDSAFYTISKTEEELQALYGE